MVMRHAKQEPQLQYRHRCNLHCRPRRESIQAKSFEELPSDAKQVVCFGVVLSPFS